MLAIGVRNQLALRCEARRRGLRAIHVEHGYRLPLAVQRELRGGRHTPPQSSLTPRLTRSSLPAQRFFAGSLLRLPPRTAARLARQALPSIGGASIDAHEALADLRRPDRYVSFSPECFSFHRELDRVPGELAEQTVYVGVPQFDCFRSGGERVEPDAGTAVLVDHQLHNTGFLGWDREHHRRWAAGIHDAIAARGLRLVVKAHPGERSSPWTAYDDGSVELVPTIEELEQRSRSARVALGVVSTLQLPLAGLDQIATITVEVHPQSGHVLSRGLVEAGVAHPVTSYEELGVALGDVAALHRDQLPHKPAFVERFLHRLDGQGGERLTDAVMAEAGTQ